MTEGKPSPSSGSATPGPPYEIRTATTLEEREVLDELVVRGAGTVHFEAMDENYLWCGITLPDGRRLVVNVWSEGEERLRWRVSEDWPGGKEYADAD